MKSKTETIFEQWQTQKYSSPSLENFLEPRLLKHKLILMNQIIKSIITKIVT